MASSLLSSYISPMHVSLVIIIVAAFQFCCMALAVDLIDRRGHSNEMHRQLQPEKTKVRLYLPFI